MDTIESLTAEIDAAEKAIEPKKEQLRVLQNQRQHDVAERVRLAKQLKGSFSLDELTFAAHSKCACGAGYAYPNNIGAWGSWYCSAILLGRAERGSTHGGEMPFSFYEVKSENQPSANGETTRPKE
jgi:hypothetical protein